MPSRNEDGSYKGPIIWWRSFRRCPDCKAYLMTSYNKKFYCTKCQYRENMNTAPAVLTESFGIPELPGYHV